MRRSSTDTYCRVVYPFTAIVGQEKMQKGLILNAVNPRLGGILIRGEKGTAKSTAVRALAALLPEIEVVADCPFGCDPGDVTAMCGEVPGAAGGRRGTPPAAAAGAGYRPAGIGYRGPGSGKPGF